MGPEIVYVSGRKRASGEMNGKSANLNNCLTYIYPAGTTIPANELVCIFDADQVWFFSLLPPTHPTHQPDNLPVACTARRSLIIQEFRLV